MNDFALQTETGANSTVVYLDGYLDAHTAPELEGGLQQLIESGTVNIVVDFERLDYISSAGLGVFMAYIEVVRENGGDIKLSRMSEKVYNVFDLLGFPMLYDIFPTLEEAKKAFISVDSETDHGVTVTDNSSTDSNDSPAR